MQQILLAYIFTGFIAIAVLFQFALICGAPWGHLAMGGRYPGSYPVALRVAALLQSALLIFFALVALTKAGIIWPQYYDMADSGIWIVAVVSGLSLIMNLATPSKWERILWAPVAFVMVVTSGLLAIQGGT